MKSFLILLNMGKCRTGYYYQDKKIGPLSYSYVHIPYDIEKELSSPISNPEKEAYENELRYAKYRDMGKLELKIK